MTRGTGEVGLTRNAAAHRRDPSRFQAGLERRGAFFILGLDRHDKAPRTLVPPRSISELSDDAPGGTRGQ